MSSGRVPERPHPDDLRPAAFWHDFKLGVRIAPWWLHVLLVLLPVAALAKVLP